MLLLYGVEVLVIVYGDIRTSLLLPIVKGRGYDRDYAWKDSVIIK